MRKSKKYYLNLIDSLKQEIKIVSDICAELKKASQPVPVLRVVTKDKIFDVQADDYNYNAFGGVTFYLGDRISGRFNDVLYWYNVEKAKEVINAPKGDIIKIPRRKYTQ